MPTDLNIRGSIAFCGNQPKMLMLNLIAGTGCARIRYDPASYHEHKLPDDPRMQKIISTAFTSFSTLGLALILGIGGTLILVSFSLEPLVWWVVRRCKKRNSYALCEWSMNETLQLQSAVHEELGFGTWTRDVATVPITKPGERLAVVDMTDLRFLRFAVPKQALEKYYEP
jgi:hypothetical protein